MDEVHYLADRFRGAVWEEVIIHLPESVALVSLSATVSNAEEFGEWLETVRGATTTIVEERRPVPLYQHVMVGRRMFDLFADDAGVSPDPTPEVNPELVRVARDDWRAGRTRRPARQARAGRSGAAAPAASAPRRLYLPSRYDVVEQLDSQGLLPGDRVHLQPGRLRRGRAAVPEREPAADHARRSATRSSRSSRSAAGNIPDEDLHVLGYHDFLDGLTRGIAAHHAGMLPTFKECVEELFAARPVQGRVRHRDAGAGHQHAGPRVVIEKLSKWNGETHADITPGEYTQLTGRAGRRGIDVEGHGVVLWQPGFDPKAVAGLASTRTYPLKSSFRPSYNMAVNLVHQVGRATRPRAARVLVRAVPGRQGRGRAGPAAAQGRGGPRGVRRGGAPATSATSWSTPGCAAGSSDVEADLAQVAAAPTAAPRSSTRWRRCAPAT